LKTILNLVDDGQLWKFHGGIHPPSRKERTQDSAIVTIPMPATLYIPVSQHIGQPALPVISAGMDVAQGQLLARKEGFISANVIAPTDANISDIRLHGACHPSGIATQTIILETSESRDELTFSPLTLSSENSEIIERISASGITGLGGASFPTAVKLAPNKPIDYLIINAAECEPYITADDALMRERASEIIDGIKVMQKLLSPQRTIIAIEDNKPQAIAAMETAADDTIIVRAIPTLYPAGGEKQLIEVLTSMQVPSGKIPADIGIVVQNIATAYAAGKAVLKGQPLVSRIVTVTGDLVQRPGNYEVPLGMSIKDLLEHCGFSKVSAQKIIVGGPMMGFSLNDINAPIVKSTNCIIAASDTELPNPPIEQNCIRCGDCEQVCPAELLPQQLQWFAKDQDYDKLKEHDLFDCIECGACAYVCPSSIPLVQYYRVAKAEIRSEDREKEQAQRAKERFEARTARLERDKTEREERNRLAAEKRKAAMSNNNDGDAVAAALARVKAKKSQTSASTDAAPEDRVAAAIASAKAKKAQATQPAVAEPSEQVTDQKSRVADAIARAKAKKLAAQQPKVDKEEPVSESSEPASQSPEQIKKARIAATIAKAKAKKLASQQELTEQEPTQESVQEITDSSEPVSQSPEQIKKARIAATIAKAKAKKLAAQQEPTEQEPTQESVQEVTDSSEPASQSPEQIKKARIAATIAKAKAKKLAAQKMFQQEPTKLESAQQEQMTQTQIQNKTSGDSHIAAAMAKAKNDAEKEASQVMADASIQKPQTMSPEEQKKARIAKVVAKAKAKALANKNLDNKDN